jgi:hypothetical protein
MRNLRVKRFLDSDKLYGFVTADIAAAMKVIF